MQAKAGYRCCAPLSADNSMLPCEGSLQVTMQCALCPFKEDTEELVDVSLINEDTAEDAK